MTIAKILLSFDYGEKRIGVGLGNSLTGYARPLSVIENRSRNFRKQAIGQLIIDWEPEFLVVGLPFYSDGKSHRMTKLARHFGHQLMDHFKLEVIWVDERYSSLAASHFVSKKGYLVSKVSLHAEAARIILQQYFDENRFS